MLKIKSELNSLEIARSGAIWGCVWFDLDGEQFPEARWNDLAVAVVSESLEAVRHLERNIGRRRITFFDGPFWVDLERTVTGQLLASTSTCLYSSGAMSELAILTAQVESAAHDLVTACREMGASQNDDVMRLEILCAMGR